MDIFLNIFIVKNVSVSHDNDRAFQGQTHQRHRLEKVALNGRIPGNQDQETDG
jgi:hypothetical protein